MITEKVLNVYGIPPNWKPPTKKQFHGTTYLEYEIPKKLDKKLSKIIDKELKDFYKKCKCESCKKDRHE